MKNANNKKKEIEMNKSIFQKMADDWQAPIVARTEILNFTGGALSDRYLANLDSLGQGPSGRFRMGRKIVYPVRELVLWLQKRSTTIKA